MANEAAEKTNKMKEIRVKTQKVNAIANENAKQDDTANTYNELKEFLEELNSEEFEKERQVQRESFVASVKYRWIEARMGGEDPEDFGHSTKDKKDFLEKKKQELGAEFDQLVEKGEIEEIEEFDNNYPLQFKDPKDLIEYFSLMEEKNLVLINMSQSLEQQRQEVMKRYEEMEMQMQLQVDELKENKKKMKASNDTMARKIAELRASAAPKTNSGPGSGFRRLENKISEVITELNSEMIRSELSGVIKDNQNKGYLLKYLAVSTKMGMSGMMPNWVNRPSKNT